jgi:transposase InsO family protein
MQVHANARLGPIGRRLLVDRIEREGWSVRVAAASSGVSEQTARKWIERWREEGETGLRDRGSRPATIANRTPDRRVEAIAALRRLRFTGREIAELLDLAPSTVSGILTRIGMGRLGRVGLAPAVRYQRDRPGELVHIDVKKLGRIGRVGKRITGLHAGKTTPVGLGWERVQIAIDDATRLAYAEVLPDEKAITAVGFLERALTFFARSGITVQRVMTDNGAPYLSAAHAVACRRLGLRHLRTRAYRPQTNGKAERFIRSMLGECIYSGAIYRTSSERASALDGWLWHYNHRRQHGALNHTTPAARLTDLNNLIGPYS